MKQTHSQRYGQFCVLSVDDDVVNLMVVEQLLSPQGWKIVSAQDGEDALAALEEEETFPDFVFLDYQMNVGDSGDEICRKMRQVFNGKPIPIVMCTAMTAGSAALEACKHAGATDYLLKPYERNRMIAKIEQYCLEQVRASRPYEPGALPPTPAPPPAAMPAPPAPQGLGHTSAPGPSSYAPAATSTPATGQQGTNDILVFFVALDLEYCGQKLVDAGVTLDQLRGMDDLGLRRAGIVVKSQRDKILEALGR